MRDGAGGSPAPAGRPSGEPASSSAAAVVELSSAAKAAIRTTSAVKDFATVAKEARATMDDWYAKAGEKDSPSMVGAKVQEMFSSLDRRSLYAIKSNEGGKFSALEQDRARTEMMTRLSNDTGMADLGKIDFKSNSIIYKKAVTYLDNVSAEEKTSFEWAKDRAVLQSDYEATSRAAGEEPEKLDSPNPLVKLLKAAVDSLTDLGDPSKQVEDMPLYKQAQALFASQQAGGAATVDVKA
ncbi:hypothetical protein NS228_26925 [Methylobacterium indicum]|nr:hypothetical protein NS229_28925 [Methylobacterium indicum]KTS24210.1 hypothetical protein NS228_26925 [Methylobacterium indicum]KTS53467.1 hypothetical protein NS230_05770 [Methylobacterium indicum]